VEKRNCQQKDCQKPWGLCKLSESSESSFIYYLLNITKP
jgi:hypothetical protein